MNEKRVLNSIVDMLLSLGFREERIGLYTNYVMGSTYCIPNYVDGVGYLIEYAKTKNDAVKYLHEDSDAVSDDMDDYTILNSISSDIFRNVPELRNKHIATAST